MKIKWKQGIELELMIVGMDTPQKRTYQPNQIIEVKKVDLNDAFKTATIELNDFCYFYGIPQETFEVVEL